MEPCIICHEEFEEDSLTISCEKNHTIHYSCYEAWRKEKYGNNFGQLKDIPCVYRCNTVYRDSFGGYIEVFLLSAKHELFDICDDILRNKLKGFPLHLLFGRASGNLRAMLFLFEEGYIPWNAEEHLEQAILSCVRCFDTTLVQRVLEFAWKQGFKPSRVLKILPTQQMSGLYWMRSDESISTIIKFLISTCGFEPEKYKPLYKFVAQYKNPFVIKELIKSGRYNLDEQDKDGWTALHYAVKKNCIDIFFELINAGARMDIQDVNGYNAVDVAYYYYKDEYVQWMVNRGGAMTEAAKRGERPRYNMPQQSSPPFAIPYLHANGIVSW